MMTKRRRRLAVLITISGLAATLAVLCAPERRR